jgi:glycine/D-amino acid oxidase-like deaminating enzyme
MATPDIPQELLVKLLGQITQDPGIPVENYTVSAWQEPPHPLAEIQSKSLPERTDFAIIGSGITGCSVARTLLENKASGNKSGTVFEARRLTTGATSRNGGFLMSHVPLNFAGFAKAHGTENAVQIARFCERTLAEIIEVAKAENLYKESQIRDVESIITFGDQGGLVQGTESFQMYQEHVPEFKGTYHLANKEQIEKVSTL